MAVRVLTAWALVSAVVALSWVAAAGPAAAQTAEITFLHAIPGVEVEVWANGDVLIDGFEVGDREDLSALAGETLVDLELRDPASGTPIIVSDTGSDTLPADGSWTIVAHLDDTGQPVLSVFNDDDSLVAAGEGRLTIRHVADTGPIFAVVNGEPFGDGIGNAMQATKALEEGSYEVLLFDESDELFVDPANFQLEEGQSLILYAVGSAADMPLTIEQERTVPNEDAEADPEPEPDPEPEAEPTVDAFVMAETDTLNSAPAAVDTGLGPLAVTSISWPRTLAVVLSVLMAAVGGVFAVRSRRHA